MKCQNAVFEAVAGAVWDEVSGTTYRDGAVDLAMRWAVNEAVGEAVSGAVWGAVRRAVADPDHPALQDFMRSAAAGVGAV